jgi:membrane protein
VFDLMIEKAIAFVMVLAGGPLLLAVLVALAVVHGIGGWLSGIPVLGGSLGRLLALSSPLLFVPVVFGLLFRYLPPVRLRWRDIAFPTVLCSAAWMLGTELLVLYAVYFGHNVSAYGALGGALVIMLWIKTMSQVLFFGAELCKVSSRRETS